MMNPSHVRIFLVSAALLGFLGVTLGAFGAITPVGGVLLLAGWAMLAWEAKNILTP